MELTAEELQGKIDAALKPIKDKNTELLGKLVGFKKFEDIDLEKLQEAAVKLEAAEQEKLEAEGKWEEAYTKLKGEHQGVVDELKVANGVLKGELESTTLKNGVTIELMGLDIIGDLSEVAVTTLLAQASLNEEGAVVMGDKPIADFMTEWAEGPVGKHFIKSGNSGGDSGGNSGDDHATFEQYFKPGTVNQTKQEELRKTNLPAFELLDKQYNQGQKLPSVSRPMGGQYP